MNTLIRKVALLAVVALLVAGAAYAGAPSSGTSTRPLVLKVVATDNGGSNGPNLIDGGGNCIFIVRDAVPNVIPGALVVVGFAGCPQVQLCANTLPAPLVTASTPGLVNCVARTVSATTDISGTVTLRVMGRIDPAAAVTFPTLGLPAPGGYLGCATVTVTVPGFPAVIYPNIKASAMDIDGGGGVDGGDLSAMVADRFVTDHYRERSDHDGLPDNLVSGGDLSVASGVRLGGGSTVSCSVAGCP